MLEVFREDPDRCSRDNFNGLYPARIALIAMIGACLFKEFEDFMQVKSVKIFFKYEFWRMYRIVNHLTIILAIIIQAHLEYKMVTAKSTKEYAQEKELSDSMVAIATTISFLHILYWIQLHNTMGPIVISLSKVCQHMSPIAIIDLPS